jgi:hypothetical protein
VMDRADGEGRELDKAEGERKGAETNPSKEREQSRRRESNRGEAIGGLGGAQNPTLNHYIFKTSLHWLHSSHRSHLIHMD